LIYWKKYLMTRLLKIGDEQAEAARRGGDGRRGFGFGWEWEWEWGF
jgi:hypothetical protein